MDDMRIKHLSNEAAGWRVKFRTTERELADTKKRLSELETQLQARPATAPPVASSSSPPAGDPQADASASPGATSSGADSGSGSDVDTAGGESGGADTSELASVYETALRSHFVKRLGEAGAIDGEIALELLDARERLLIGDDNEPALLVDGQPQPLTDKTLEAALGPSLMKSVGVGGAGSRAGAHVRTSDPSIGIDEARYVKDVKYRQEVLRQRRGRS
jgi:hypothetical protein